MKKLKIKKLTLPHLRRSPELVIKEFEYREVRNQIKHGGQNIQLIKKELELTIAEIRISNIFNISEGQNYKFDDKHKTEILTELNNIIKVVPYLTADHERFKPDETFPPLSLKN